MKCKYCNNEFQSIGTHNLFCSPICRRRERRNKELGTNTIVKERSCLICNSLINLEARADKVLCSKKCKDVYFTKTQKEVIDKMLNESYTTNEQGVKVIYSSGTNAGIKILVDANLYDWLNNYKWFYTDDYPKHERVSLHVLLKHLWNWGDKVCDHRDRNKLNNTQSNLRPSTLKQNASNKPGLHTSKVPYKGVHISASGKYQAMIWYNKKNHALGSFNTAEEAALAYNKAALLHQGEFAYLNVIT